MEHQLLVDIVEIHERHFVEAVLSLDLRELAGIDDAPFRIVAGAELIGVLAECVGSLDNGIGIYVLTRACHRHSGVGCVEGKVHLSGLGIEECPGGGFSILVVAAFPGHVAVGRKDGHRAVEYISLAVEAGHHAASGYVISCLHLRSVHKNPVDRHGVDTVAVDEVVDVFEGELHVAAVILAHRHRDTAVFHVAEDVFQLIVAELGGNALRSLPEVAPGLSSVGRYFHHKVAVELAAVVFHGIPVEGIYRADVHLGKEEEVLVLLYVEFRGD